MNTESDLRLAARTGASAVLTDRVNWAVPYINTHKLQFKSIRV